MKLQRPQIGNIQHEEAEESLPAKPGRDPKLSELPGEMEVSAEHLLEISRAYDTVSSIAGLGNTES